MRAPASIASLIALAALHSPAQADMRPMLFAGLIQSVSDDSGILSGAVSPGDAFSLGALLDSLAPDTNPDPVWGAYDSIGTVLAPRLTLGLPALTISSPAASLVVANDLPAPAPNPPALDLFRLEAAFDTITLGRHIAFFVQLLLIDDAATALSDDSMPASSPDPANYASARQLIITGALVGGPEQFTIFATVSVPTPGALAQCVIAVAPLLRRKQRSIR